MGGLHFIFQYSDGLELRHDCRRKRVPTALGASGRVCIRGKITDMDHIGNSIRFFIYFAKSAPKRGFESSLTSLRRALQFHRPYGRVSSGGHVVAAMRRSASSIILAQRVCDHLCSSPLTHISTNSSITVVSSPGNVV
jgi:hypothetical protein